MPRCGGGNICLRLRFQEKLARRWRIRSARDAVLSFFIIYNPAIIALILIVLVLVILVIVIFALIVFFLSFLLVIFVLQIVVVHHPGSTLGRNSWCGHAPVPDVALSFIRGS